MLMNPPAWNLSQTGLGAPDVLNEASDLSR
jgi:hypothetical protein